MYLLIIYVDGKVETGSQIKVAWFSWVEPDWVLWTQLWLNSTHVASWAEL